MNINEKNISCVSHHKWESKKSFFKNLLCNTCKKPLKNKDKVLRENDISNDLVINRYCKSCGNKRLNEIVNYYKGLIKE